MLSTIQPSTQPFLFSGAMQTLSPSEFTIAYTSGSSPIATSSLDPMWQSAPSNGSFSGMSPSPSSPKPVWDTKPAKASGEKGSTPPSRYVEIRPKLDASPNSSFIRERSRSPKHESDDGSAVTTDFVRKLFTILEEGLFPSIVAWNARGDCFIIKDVGEFTKSILPRMFKHSNFASFVRQLNKYDFHKVRISDDQQFGDQSWTFRHRDFQRGRRDALDHIKRKLPCPRKSSPGSSSSSLNSLQVQLQHMERQQAEMTAHIRQLENNYETVLTEVVSFQKNLAQQDELMRGMLQCYLQLEDGGEPVLTL